MEKISDNYNWEYSTFAIITVLFFIGVPFIPSHDQGTYFIVYLFSYMALMCVILSNLWNLKKVYRGENCIIVGDGILRKEIYPTDILDVSVKLHGKHGKISKNVVTLKLADRTKVSFRTKPLLKRDMDEEMTRNKVFRHLFGFEFNETNKII
jgi:hypothetical protein